MVDAMCRNQGSGGEQHKNTSCSPHHDDAKTSELRFSLTPLAVGKKGSGTSQQLHFFSVHSKEFLHFSPQSRVRTLCSG